MAQNKAILAISAVSDHFHELEDLPNDFDVLRLVLVDNESLINLLAELITHFWGETS